MGAVRTAFKHTVEFAEYHRFNGLPSSCTAAWNGWVVTRAKYADTALLSLISLVKNAVRTVYDTIIAATAGLGFTNENLRNRVKASASVTTEDLVQMLKSVLGVLWPYFERAIDDWLKNNSKNTVIPPQVQVSPPAEVQEVAAS